MNNKPPAVEYRRKYEHLRMRTDMLSTKNVSHPSLRSDTFSTEILQPLNELKQWFCSCWTVIGSARQPLGSPQRSCPSGSLFAPWGGSGATQLYGGGGGGYCSQGAVKGAYDWNLFLMNSLFVNVRWSYCG